MGAEGSQGRGAHVGLHANRHRDAAAADGAELFGGDDRVAVVQAHAAEFLRLGNAQQAQVAGHLEDFVDGEFAGLFPLVDVRVDFLVDKVTDRATQFFVFLGEDHFYAPKGYRRATPKVLELSGRTAASAQMSSKKPSSLRVSRGSVRAPSPTLAGPS